MFMCSADTYRADLTSPVATADERTPLEILKPISFAVAEPERLATHSRRSAGHCDGRHVRRAADGSVAREGRFSPAYRRTGPQGSRRATCPAAQHVEPSERSHQGCPKHAYTFRTRRFARIAVWNGQVCGAQWLTRGLRLRGRQQPVAKLVQVRRGNPFNASGSTRCRKFRDRPGELQMKRGAGPRKDPP